MRFIQFLYIVFSKNCVVFIQRGILPNWGPIFEYLLDFFGKPIVYDIDDAIYFSSLSKRGFRYVDYKKPIKISRIARAVITSTAPIADYLRNVNTNIYVIPTLVPDVEFKSKKFSETENQRNVIIGWIGNRKNLKYLDIIIPVLNNISKNHKIKLYVLSDKLYENEICEFSICSKLWFLDNEAKFLHTFDIGIMPLINSPYNRSKAGFKLIRYQSIGIPVIASNVGFNAKIISHATNGYLCNSISDWNKYLNQLIVDVSLRKKFGEAGYSRAFNRYRLENYREQYKKIILSVLD